MKKGIDIGYKFKHPVKFTQKEVEHFSMITGDDNPIHLDHEYASRTRFKRPIVHGMLSAAVFSKVFGTLFPGEGSIYLSQEINFKSPVYVDHSYSAEFEVMEVDPIKGIALIKCALYDENFKACTTGNARVMNKESFSYLN